MSILYSFELLASFKHYLRELTFLAGAIADGYVGGYGAGRARETVRLTILKNVHEEILPISSTTADDYPNHFDVL